MNVDILYFTYNRLDNTKVTLPNLLESTAYPFNLTIVDNGSTEDTVLYLKEVVNVYKSKRTINLILNKTNEGLSKPTNDFWRSSAADLVGKIDNDIVVEYGWLEKLVEAHKSTSNLAVIGGFHFPKEVFKYKACKHNIFKYKDTQIIRQTHIGGNYIAKRSILLENGFLNVVKFKLGGWTDYQRKRLSRKYIIGYHYPLITFKHLQESSDEYFKKVRGKSRAQYLAWEINDGKKLLNNNWGW